MAEFSEIEFWPSSGGVDRPWTDDPATDALVKSAVRISEAYGEAVRAERLAGPSASLRFFSHLHDADEVQLQVDTGKPDSWESALVLVPEAVAGLSAFNRGRLVLDLIDDAVRELSPHRGWPLDAVERVRTRVVDQGLQFTWASPWKNSPDRSMSARVVFRGADDGFGRATIEVRDRKSSELIARSAPSLAYGHLVSAKRSAKTLRWVKRRVEFVPRPGWPHEGEWVSMDPELREICPEQSEDTDDGATSGNAIPAIVRAPYGSHVVDKTPGVDLFMGFGVDLRSGMVPDVNGASFSEVIELELFDRIGSGEAGVSEWLDGLPVEVTLEYHLPGQVEGFGDYGIRLRRTKKRLSVVVLRDATWIASDEITDATVRREVSDLVDQVIAAMHGRVVKSAPR